MRRFFSSKDRDINVPYHHTEVANSRMFSNALNIKQNENRLCWKSV